MVEMRDNRPGGLYALHLYYWNQQTSLVGPEVDASVGHGPATGLPEQPRVAVEEKPISAGRVGSGQWELLAVSEGLARALGAEKRWVTNLSAEPVGRHPSGYCDCFGQSRWAREPYSQMAAKRKMMDYYHLWLPKWKPTRLPAAILAAPQR